MIAVKSGYAYERDLLNRFVEYLNSVNYASVSLKVYTGKLSCAIGSAFHLINVAYTTYFDCGCKIPNTLKGLRVIPGFSLAVCDKYLLLTRDRHFYLSNRKAFYTIYKVDNYEDILSIVERFHNISTEKPILKKL